MKKRKKSTRKTFVSYDKTHWQPGTMLYPVPAVLISCGTRLEEYNILTVSWAGTVCTNPPMLSISLRPERYSYDIIKKNMEFVVNLPSRKIVKAVDYCGVRSGRKENKWEACNFKPIESKVIKTPQIESCPVSIECKVKQILPLGSHDCFISEVVGVSVFSELINKKGRLQLEKAELVSYVHGAYFAPGKILGTFGYSVKKA